MSSRIKTRKYNKNTESISYETRNFYLNKLKNKLVLANKNNSIKDNIELSESSSIDLKLVFKKDFFRELKIFLDVKKSSRFEIFNNEIILMDLCEEYQKEKMTDAMCDYDDEECQDYKDMIAFDKKIEEIKDNVSQFIVRYKKDLFHCNLPKDKVLNFRVDFQKNIGSIVVKKKHKNGKIKIYTHIITESDIKDLRKIIKLF